MIQTLLLAAGASRRFGANKLLEPLADGTPMLVRSTGTLRDACGSVLVVVRPGDEAARRLLAPLPEVEIAACRDADSGMGKSLAWGVACSPGADGWLVALADMPFVRAESVRAVRDALTSGASIAATVYGGRRGHPVGFARSWRDDLLALTGDRGGQAILRAHPGAVTLVPCEDPGVLRDIDTRGDLRLDARRG